MAKTTAEKIKVMEAFDNDFEIESICNSDVGSKEWKVDKTPSWNWEFYDYRIKKESTKRPMNFEEIKSYWLKNRDKIIISAGTPEILTFITGVNNNEEIIIVNNIYYSAEQFCKHFFMEDGNNFEIEE